MKLNLMVIFGGKSTEHDISILSSMQAIENLDKNKYNIIPVYITKENRWLTSEKFLSLKTFENFSCKNEKEVALLPTSDYLYIKKFGKYKPYKKIDCAMIIMHGKNGEDGTLQGLMELSNIPYTSSGILASSLGMSKLAQKIYFEGLDMPILPYFSLTKAEYEKLGSRIELSEFSFPVVVKPNRLGSSIGISFCSNQKELSKAVELAFMFDDTIVVEQGVKDLKEVNISVIGDKNEILLSETEEPICQNHILTFNDKYVGKKSKQSTKTTKAKICCPVKTKNQNGMQSLSRKVPADIDETTKKQIENMATEIFEKMECKGVIRIDFIIDKMTKKTYVNEVNTIPGSLAFYLWEEKGLKFSSELDKIIEMALKEFKQKEKLKTVFESNVLKNF